jgi:TFIIF-interacting CTD phosphatase-like protein
MKDYSLLQDLSVLGRDLASTIIIDNSPHSYVFHPENAVPISTFIDEPEDCVSASTLRWTELVLLCEVESGRQ